MLLEDESFMKRAYALWTEDHIVRELRESWFVDRESAWMQGQYNILYIHRPYNDVVLCNDLRNWFEEKWLRPRYEYLERIRRALKDSRNYAVIDYDDLIHDHKIVFEILKGWYPSVNVHDYIDSDWRAMREDVAIKIKILSAKIRARQNPALVASATEASAKSPCRAR